VTTLNDLERRNRPYFLYFTEFDSFASRLRHSEDRTIMSTCSTVVAQDHRRSCLPRRRCKSPEHAAAGDHVTTVTGGIQARTEDGTVP